VLLALDVGNTETVIGLFEETAENTPRPPTPIGDEGGELPDLRYHWRVATEPERTADEHALLLVDLLRLVGIDVRGDELFRHISGLAVSSSVPGVTAALRRMVARWFPVPLVVVGPGVRTGMPVLYDNPKEVGADRIANAVGAVDLMEPPLIVVDIGTATTFDVVSSAGEYLGGAISPGLEVSAEALFDSAAALPRVELTEPRRVVGKSTVESIQSGIVYGYAGLVDGLCQRIIEDLGQANVVATGGLAGLITPHSRLIAYHEPWLTLHGLRLVYERNAVAPETRR
jgi:type III pantothenate kinase